MRDTVVEPTSGPAGEARLRAALEKAGWRCTRQRAAVFAFLSATPDHPTAEQVHAAVRRDIPNISLATVYKALDALVAARLASRIADDHGPTRYDGNASEHYHLRCLQTGQVRDLPLAYDPRLPDKLSAELIEALRRQGFVVTGHRLELLGHFTDR
jgi:Fur family transcriptional regulator, peroxide stress response regulator